MILLFTGIAVVVLAFVFAIRAVRAWEDDMNSTEMLDQLEQVRVEIRHFRMLPRSSGGVMLGFTSSKLNLETEDYYFKTVKNTKTEMEVEAYSKLYPSKMMKYTLQENIGSPCRNYPTVEFLDNFSFTDEEGEDADEDDAEMDGEE